MDRKFLRPVLIGVLGAVLLTLIVSAVYSLVVYTSRSVTIGWEHDMLCEDGYAMEGVSFEVYLAGVDKISPLLLGTATGNEYKLVVPEGRWVFGVTAVRMDGTQEVSRSEMSWSDDPSRTVSGEQLFLEYYRKPKPATGLRVSW
jgi:hypothetical protein